MLTRLKLDDKMVEEAVKLGNFKTKEQALNAALTEFVQRHNRLRILELAGKINFDPGWDHKKMRGKR
ncbi:MAG: type II toxin-antitoxin system VapB family antitoxin [Verrucomicrobiota bacterium]